MPIQPPPEGSDDPPRFDWEGLRSEALQPQFVSELSEDDAKREEFLAGAKALGLIGRRKVLHPQQLLVADMLNAGRKFNGIIMPRRSTKTTSILAWLIGRGLSREDEMLAYGVMTTQKKARDRYMKDVVPILEKTYPVKATRPFKLLTANGFERIVFDNGSVLVITGPNPDDYRSEAFDVIVLDEGGELEAERGADVLGAALPTMDTRPGAMLVASGTAGEFAKGNVLYDRLVPGRRGDPRYGILEYAADEATTDVELEAWESDDEHPEAHVRELVELTHPGLASGLTTLADVRDNYETLGPEKFGREYLGIWGAGAAGGGLIDLNRWAESALDDPLPEPPERFAMAMAVHPDQRCASIVAAWREEGLAYIGVLDARPGISWVSERAMQLSREYGVPIVIDSGGAGSVELEFMQRQRPRPKLAPQAWRDVRIAAGAFVKELNKGHVRHYDQDELNDAAKLVVKRKAGGSDGWAFGRRNATDDITPIEAAALALKVYDAKPSSRLTGLKVVA
jgi:hypothetical protein